jgi:hypothetical protein
VEAQSEPAPQASRDAALIEALRMEILELKAHVASLANRNAELTRQMNNERYERPPHY